MTRTYDPHLVRVALGAVEIPQTSFASGEHVTRHPIAIPFDDVLEEEPEVAITAQPRADIAL